MMRTRPFFRVPAVGAAVWLLLATPLGAQQQQSQDGLAAQLAADRALLATETYVMPPKEIADLVTAPRHLNVSLTQPSPDRKHFLKQESEGLPGIAAFGKPHLYFGGLQVDPQANRARQLTTRGFAGLQLVDATTGRTTSIETPKNATVSSPTWSPLGRQIAWIANFDDASHIWVADVTTGKSQQITRTPLLATLVTSVDWTADGKSVIAVLLPDGRAAAPKAPPVADGPLVRLHMDGVKQPERNFWSLLQDPYEMKSLEYFVTGQLALIDVRTKAVKKIGAPTMISSVDAAPDGQTFRVTSMLKPFSYTVQYSSFGNVQQIWDANGKVLAEISKRPLREGIDPDDPAPQGGGRGGQADEAKRGLSWMPQGAGLYYLERVPGRAGADSTDAAPGDAAARGGRAGGRAGGAAGATRPDRLVQWLPPYGATDTKVLYTAEGPISNVIFTDDAKTIFAATTANNMGEIYAVNLDNPSKKFTIVRERG
jgi:dipeptidyl aminopeptidase/acylaminoacyl peptidase